VTEQAVHAALRSDARMVLIEAPAGCGKTHQGADYARHLAETDGLGRPLILTHTHAACSVFAERTRGTATRVDIRTIDSVVAQIAGAYHAGLGIPVDTAAWVRQQPKDGYAQLCLKVSKLLGRHPMIARSLAQRHQTVICDEHQDATGDQHAIVSALMNEGARLRIFADPMQRIFKDKTLKGSNAAWDWETLKTAADSVNELDQPQRWKHGCPDLGAWTLKARTLLKSGQSIDLTKDLPCSVTVVIAENQAKKPLDYLLTGGARKPIDAFQKQQSSLLVLTHHNPTARSISAFFNRSIPLWEGHVRSGLESLVVEMTARNGNREALAAAVVQFMDDVGKGFSPSAFGDRFQKEVHDGCAKPAKGKPASIQELARFLVDEPDHHGVARLLQRVAQFRENDPAFADIEIDCQREFWDAVRVGAFDTADTGLAEITHRRTHTRPKPPARAISTIHKAKGLECDAVIVMPCDATTFPDKFEARCLLYVALSRATKRLMLVVSKDKPTPLFTI